MGNQSQEYTKVLENLWSCVTTGSLPHIAKVLYQLADQMSENEVLWLDNNENFVTKRQLKYLVESGILVVDPDRDKFAFSHQTIFEFCRAKSLLNSDSLSNYVLHRQDSLLIRPTLWSVFKYLRDSDIDRFFLEFSNLWNLEPIRLHLQLLMIDFIAQVNEITTRDANYILAALKHSKFRRRSLGAIAGRMDWFNIIKPIMSELMLEDPVKAVDLIPILRGGLSLEPNETLELITQNWQSKNGYDFIIYQSLDLLRVWNEKSLELLCTAIKRSGLASFYVDNFVQRFFLEKPDQAIEIYFAFFSNLLAQAGAITSTITQDNTTQYSSDDSWLKLAVKKMEDPRIQHFKNILDFSELQTLEKIANLAPKQYVLRLWPIFETALHETLDEPHEWVIAYLGDGASSTNLIRDDYRGDQCTFTYAFKMAIGHFAKCEPDNFLKFINENEKSNLLVQQRLFATGLLQLTETHPVQILDFLLKDPRRFKLGDSWDHHLETKNLISAIVPHLQKDRRRSLEQAVINWSQYSRETSPTASVKREDKKYDRQHRLRLMQAIPQKFRSEKLDILIKKEESSFPNLPDATAPRPEISVIEHDDFYQGATGIQIPEPDAFMDHRSRDRSARIPQKKKLASHLAKLVQDNPLAALKLINKIPLKFDEIIVAKALEQISKNSSVSKLQLIETLWKLENRSFGGPKYAEIAAQLIAEIDSDDIDVSILDLLSLLFEKTVQPEVRQSIYHKQDDWKASTSLLWSNDNFHVALQPNFFVAQSISQVCLSRETPLANEWITFLNFALHRDQSESLWLGLALTKLAHIRKANHASSLDFINTLFSQVPITRDSREGLKLIANLQSWAPTSMIEEWLFAIRRSEWANGRQGFGELLTLYHLWFPEVYWARREIELHFQDLTNLKTASKILIGAAHTIAAAWWQPSFRTLSGSYLEQLLVSDFPDCVVALSSIATKNNELPKDEQTIRLLKLLACHPKIFSQSRFYLIAQKLESLLDFCPSEACLVAQAIASQLKADLTDYKTEKPIIAGNLVSIAITLQRLGGENRVQGINLFESLLENEIHDAFSALSDLDQRPAHLLEQTPPKSRNRNRRKKTI